MSRWPTVVPWAMSPRTVAAPVLQRRPTARSCMGERSCASSRTTCPKLGVRVRWSASSSRSTVSARDQRAAAFVRGGLSHNRIRCSSSDRRPAACFASHAASESRVKRSALASRAGQSCAAYRFTAVLRATESWTRSSGESPLRSICSSTAWRVAGAASAGPRRSELPAGAAPRWLVHLVRGDPPASGPARHHQGLARLAHLRPGSAVEELCQPRISFENSGFGAVDATDRDGGHELFDGRVPDRDLAEGGRTAPMCSRKARLGPMTRTPEREPVPEGVEEPRGPVQPHGGLARPRCALHADGLVRAGRTISSCSGWIVATMSRIGPTRGALDLLGEDPAARLVLRPVLEVLVLVRGDPAAVEPEAAPEHHAHRLRPRGPVEGRGHTRAPVDDEGVAVVVGDVAAPDVPALPAVGVDPAEEERRGGVVLEGGCSQVEGAGEVLRRDGVVGLHLEERVCSRIRARAARAAPR